MSNENPISLRPFDLEAAVMRGEVDTVRFCLESGLDPNATNDMGYTISAWAVVSRAPLEVFKVLHKFGAEFSKVGSSGTNAVDLSVAFCRPDLLAYFAEVGSTDLVKKNARDITLDQMPVIASSSSELSKLRDTLKSLMAQQVLSSSFGPLESAFSPTQAAMPGKPRHLSL